jgi:hypothetical protein
MSVTGSPLDRAGCGQDHGRMQRNRPNPVVLTVVLALHVVVTTLVWRDIRRRPDSQLRGDRRLWRVLTALNTGNSLVYALLGVRRRS